LWSAAAWRCSGRRGILGQRAGAFGNAPIGGGAERHQLQHRAKLWPGHRRIVVATAGAFAAFATKRRVLYPLLIVLFLWRRTSEPSRLPRERLNRAMVSGVRYIANSPSIRIVPGAHAGDRHHRRLGVGADAAGGARPPARRRADLRHHARRLRHGRVIGALNIAEVRKRMSGEAAIRACALSMGGAIAAVG